MRSADFIVLAAITFLSSGVAVDVHAPNGHAAPIGDQSAQQF